MRKREENKKIKKIKIKMKTTLGYMESWSRKKINIREKKISKKSKLNKLFILFPIY